MPLLEPQMRLRREDKTSLTAPLEDITSVRCLIPAIECNCAPIAGLQTAFVSSSFFPRDCAYKPETRHVHP
jgi:hypothetical protein